MITRQLPRLVVDCLYPFRLFSNGFFVLFVQQRWVELVCISLVALKWPLASFSWKNTTMIIIITCAFFENNATLPTQTLGNWIFFFLGLKSQRSALNLIRNTGYRHHVCGFSKRKTHTYLGNNATLPTKTLGNWIFLGLKSQISASNLLEILGIVIMCAVFRKKTHT